MSRLTVSSKKISFSIFTLIILMASVVSVAFGTGGSAPVSENFPGWRENKIDLPRLLDKGEIVSLNQIRRTKLLPSDINLNTLSIDRRRFAGGTGVAETSEASLECTYSINPVSQFFDAAGSNAQIFVTTEPGCEWTAVSNVSWIVVTSINNGSGNGTVLLTILENTGVARSGTVTIAGRTYTATQAQNCTYSLPAASADITAAGGRASFDINAGTGCAWNATSNSPWITITSGSDGVGGGTISYSVQPNTGPARSGTITVAGMTFTVNQASGCTYSISPTSAGFTQTGGSGTVNVVTAPGCVWSAASNDSWITLTGSTSGSGAGTITFSVAANTSVARTGTITIAGQTFTVTQSSGCTYQLSFFSTTFPASGGTDNFNVNSGVGCPWTATTADPWITIVGGATGTGKGIVTYTVQANQGPARVGKITVNGLTFNVYQESGCTYSVSPLNFDAGNPAGTGTFTINAGAGCPWTVGSNASWLTVTSGASGTGTGTVTFSYTANTGALRTGTITAAGQTFTVRQAAAPTAFDFDGDGKADISVFRPENAVWYILNSTAGFTGVQFGLSTDKIVPADYDGDAKTDIAVFRPEAGVWYLQRSRDGFTAFAFGEANDIPVPADYDGDGKADIAVFRPSNNVWYIQQSRDGFIGLQFGQSGDVPTIGDFDGDGRSDIAVFQPSNGNWNRINSSNNQRVTVASNAAPTDLPVPADYDGDGKTDAAFYRLSSGVWYMQISQSGFAAVQFGIATDKPVPADYDGDRKADIAVFRDGTWYLRRSRDGFFRIDFGKAGDKPVPNAFIR